MLLKQTLFVTLSAVLLLASCRDTKPADTLFTLEENTGISFTNTVKNTKDFNIFSYRNFYNGGGTAIGDINNDGLPDVFFTANMGSNKLFLNKGNFSFEDVTTKAGVSDADQWSTGVVMVDINSDGWLDIYVCNAGFIEGRAPRSRLYINNKDLTFTESAEKYNLVNEGGYATHAAFFDYDLDGDLDVFIINNSFIPVNTLNYANKRDLRAPNWPVADYLKGGGDRFFRNDNGRYVDISEQAGIYGSLISFGLGVTVGDVNGDHYPDVYVSNDFFERDYLYINQKNGTFKDQLEDYMQHLSHSSMGADMADINNDGYPDLFVTEMLPDDDYRLKTTTSFENTDVQQLKVKSGFYYQFMQNTLQVNRKNGKFSEAAFFGGVAASDWSWGGLIFDADNDGLSDIYVCNGIYNDVTNQDFIDFFANDVIQKMVMTGQKEQVEEIISKMPSVPMRNKAFQNKGNLQFADEGVNWGFTDASFSNGAAYGDLDNDGDLDLVINNVNEPAFIYRNHSREKNANNYIGIQLKGKGQNSFALGAQVQIYAGSEIITRELIPSRGFQSSVDYKIIAGLGKRTVDSVIISWPDLTQTKLLKPEVNKVLQVSWTGEGPKWQQVPTVAAAALLQPVALTMDKHEEDGFVDSYYDRNIPVMLSHEGPKAAVGDVNGDGLDDVYIGGASRQAGQLYIQSAKGWTKKAQPEFERFSNNEDVAVLFFDADKDADLDLFVGSGGNNRDPGSPELMNRLYRNDGKGNFSFDSTALPSSGDNNAVVAPCDYDQDGDIDLFVGSRSVSLNYGLDPQSYLLENDGKGHFTDVTAQKAPALQYAGMITGAQWAKITGSKQADLVLAGDWMAPRIFTWQQGQLVPRATSLDGLNGWWQTLVTADLDGDGDDDLLLGNIGENFYLKPDSAHPVKMFTSDFDNNGSPEKIITRTINGRDMPVFLKRELTDQVVSIKKQNLQYKDFGNKSIQDLFTPEVMKKCKVKTFSTGTSVIAYNEGNGRFTLQAFPMDMQWSSLNAFLLTDLDGDGKKDIVAGGNRFNLLPQFCRLDASFGHVLLNRGNRTWEEQTSDRSGLLLRGQIRDIQSVRLNKQPAVLILQNNEAPVLLKIK